MAPNYMESSGRTENGSQMDRWDRADWAGGADPERTRRRLSRTFGSCSSTYALPLLFAEIVLPLVRNEEHVTGSGRARWKLPAVARTSSSLHPSCPEFSCGAAASPRDTTKAGNNRQQTRFNK